MAIIAVFILILYYYFFITFEKERPKPNHLSKPVIDLQNKLSTGQLLQPDQFYDYDSGMVKGSFDYSIHQTANQVVFTVLDNDFQKQTWTLPLIPHYFWQDGKIFENDSCNTIANHSNVRAHGKPLFDYMQKHQMMNQRQHHYPTQLFHSDRMFYFKCFNNQIQSLHSCPPGTVLNDQIQCEKVYTCTGQPNHYLYPDENSKFNYFECINEKPHSRSCPSGQLFQFDRCVVPQNLCQVRSDGFLQDLDRKSFIMCIKGESVIQSCPPFTYVLNGHCENEICENQHGTFVPIFTNNNTFEYAAQYGYCEEGRLKETFNCPTLWNHWETDVNLLHLPQVFDSNTQSCTKPVLCENVRISDPNIVIPQYTYAKYLKNWGFAKIFDLLTGYTCDSNGNRVQETMNPGQLIINFRKTKVPLKKVPTSNATQYFENNQIQQCPPQHFFDGLECKRKNPNAFSFRHLDMFELDGLYINGWLNHPIMDPHQNITCAPDFQPMQFIRACVHRDCTRFPFLLQVKGSIKIDPEYECFQKGNEIDKQLYTNPYQLKLEFWDQRLTVGEPDNICTFGTRIKTGHFVLDSTIFMTCNPNQPFVFCPSVLTQTIESVGSNIYACVPKPTVYELILPKNINIVLYVNEIDGIELLQGATVTIDRTSEYIPNRYMMDVNELKRRYNITQPFCHFMCNEEVKIKFQKLPTHPGNVYLERGHLKLNPVGVYDIIYNRQVRFIKPFQYNVKESVTDFNY